MAEPSVSFPVIGFRSWRGNEIGDLRSMAQNYCWQLGINEARCLRSHHLHRSPAPATQCSCGLYAWHDLKNAGHGYGERTIIGLVRGWGKLEVHRDGWRGQHAEVLAIISRADAEGRCKAQQAAERYGVPLLPPNVSPALISDFGRVVPEELRPDTPVIAYARGRSTAEELADLGPFVGGVLLYVAGAFLYHRLKRRAGAFLYHRLKRRR